MDLQARFEELQSLDPQNVGVWPNWVYGMFAILLAGAIIGVGIWQIYIPKQEALDQVVAKEKTLRKDFEKKQRKVASLDAYRAQLEEMRRSFGAMLRQLPNKTEVANLLNDISQTRVASGLDEKLFKPLGELDKNFYAELPNEIHVIGSYHQFGNFVAGVSALPRIVTIDNIFIEPADKRTRGRRGAPAQINAANLKMTILATTYRYLDDDEVAAKEADAAKKNKSKKR